MWDQTVAVSVDAHWSMFLSAVTSAVSLTLSCKRFHSLFILLLSALLFSTLWRCAVAVDVVVSFSRLCVNIYYTEPLKSFGEQETAF